MSKRHRLTTATIVIVLGLVVAMEAAGRQGATTPGHTTAATARPATMDIVPAPVIDPKAELFIGTGDVTEGSWVRP